MITPMLLRFLPGAITFIAVYFYFKDLFKNYSMLVETTCWINDHLAYHDLNFTLSFMWARVMNFFEIQPFSRYFSFVNISFYSYVCGTDINCHNNFQIFWIAFSGILLTIFLIQLKEHYLLSTLIALLWTFSLPVFDALTWQATIHDKLVTTFILLSLNLTYFFCTRKLTLINFVLSNCLTFIALLGAYNSKEMSFGLAPAMFLCILFFGNKNKKQWLLFILPFLYAFFNLSVHGYFILTQKKDPHVFSSGVFDHVYQYISFYFNKEDQNYGHFIANSLLYIFIFYFGINYSSIKQQIYKFELKKVVFLFCTWVLILVPALKTQFSDAFYMLAPSAFFISFSFILCREFLLDLFEVIFNLIADQYKKTSRFLKISTFCIVLIMGILFQFVNYFELINTSKNSGYLNFSENIQKAYSIIRNKLSTHNDEKIFVGFDDNKMTYKFLCHGCNYTFMFEKYDPAQNKDKLFECSSADNVRKLYRTSQDRNYYLIFDQHLSLLEIYHGISKIF